MRPTRRLNTRAWILVVANLCLLSVVSQAAPSRATTTAPADIQAASGSFTFGAAGDMGANSDASATLHTLAGAGTDFFLHLGDMSYGQLKPESAWCKFVTDRVGATFPYEIVAGGHESNTYDADVDKLAACLPHRVGALTGTYGKKYFFDYPQAPAAPLARIIMISPGEQLPEGFQSYVKGTANYAFVQSSIESAHAAGIPWVVVGMAFDCITAGEKHCEISADLFNLLVAEKVDLVLQGHEHGYERSKQLAQSGACPVVPVGSFKAACVVDDGSDLAYAGGAGPVVVISGTAGVGLRPMNTGDSEAPYFAKLMGSNISPTKGFMKYTVSPTQLSAQFVRSAGGNFADSFTITRSGTVDNPPTALAATATTPQDTPVGITLQATDAETCELTFSIAAGPANGSLSALGDQPCTPGGPNRDQTAVTYTPNAGFSGPDSFTFRVADLASNATATATVTVNPSGGGGGGPGISFRAASTGQNANATSLVLPSPAGVAANDVMLAAVAVRFTTTITPPPGWTLIRKDSGGTYDQEAVYFRVAGAAEPSSYSWTFSGAVPAAGGILDYSGVNPISPINAQGGQGNSTVTTTITAPSITTTVANATVVGMFGTGDRNSITPPSGMAERGEAVETAGNYHVTWEGSDFTLPAPGPTGPKSAAATIAHPNVGQLIALNPA